MVKYIILVLLTITIGCDSPTIIKKSDAKYKAKGVVIATLAYYSAHKGSSPRPDNVPDNATEVCPICDGTGKVGDGTHFAKCLTCDGTGKVRPRETVAMPPSLPEGFDTTDASIETISGTTDDMMVVSPVVDTPADLPQPTDSQNLDKIRELEESQKQILDMLNNLKPSVDIITEAIQKSTSKKESK